MRAIIRILSLIGLIGYSVAGQALSLKEYDERKKDDWAPELAEILEYAKLSKAAKAKFLEAPESVNDWKYVEGGERAIGKGFHAVAYKKADEMVVVFEGTDSGDDWLNQNIAKFKPRTVGRQTNNTLEFLIENEKIQNWWQAGKKTTFIGHSLGGGLAKIAGALVKNSKVITFNTAGIEKTMRNILGENSLKDANIINVTTKFDVVSTWEKYADYTIDLSGVLLNPLKNHAIQTVIEELDKEVRIIKAAREQESIAKIRKDAERQKQARVREESRIRAQVREQAQKEQAARQNRLGQFGEFIRTNTNIGNSCIGGVSYPVIVDAPAIFDANENDERVFIDNTPGNNARETVNTDGFVLEAPVDIVLNWGGNPADLDSHLTGPLSEGRRFHVNFEERGSLNSGPRVLLHMDYINHVPEGANMPEQVRVNRINDGIYRFYVHDYSNRNEVDTRNLANSGAAISIHNAGEFSSLEGVGIGEKVVPDISVPTDRVGNTWHAFDLDARTNTLIERDEFQDRIIGDQDELSAVPFNEGSAEVQ